MNIIDKAVAFFSPSAGLRRMRARYFLDTSAKLAYDAIASERRRGGWSPSNASANAEIGLALADLRKFSRDLCRNNPYAKKALREWSKRVAGDGIIPQAATGREEIDSIIDARFQAWAQNPCSDRRINWGAACKLIAQAMFESGEAVIRLFQRNPADGLAVPFQIQIIEPDYIDTSKTEQLQSGYIIEGVEFDQIGRIRGYWLFPQHPGEVVITSFKPAMQSYFVPAADCLHVAEIERPGQVRNVPRLTPVIRVLRELDEFSDAMRVQQKIAACFGAFVESPEGSSMSIGPESTDATTGKKLEEMSPGLIQYLRPGEVIKTATPPNSGSYAETKKTELREVAVGLDIPYMLLADDPGDANYSSARYNGRAYVDTIEGIQWTVLIPQAMDPVYRRFIDNLITRGDIPGPFSGYDPYGVEWHPPAFDLFDRNDEAKADATEMANGSQTFAQVCGRKGYDPNRQFDELVAWNRRFKEAGLLPPGTGGNINGQNQTAAPAA